jgi:hypothetical protein
LFGAGVVAMSVTQLEIQIFGAVVGVTSVVVTNFVSEAIDKRRKDIDAKLAKAEHDLEWCSQQFVISNQSAQFSQTLLAIVQSGNPPDLVSRNNLDEAVHAFLQSIVARYTAVNADHPSDDKIVAWTAIANRAEQKDAAAWNELSSISQGLLKEYGKNQNHRVDDRNKLAAKKADIESWAVRVQSIGGGIAILAVLVMLLKDLAPK